MARSWKATGLLQPLWGRVGGRDRLAELSGIPGPNLSGYNTGRLNLTDDTAAKIADVLGVDMAALGRPDREGDEPSPIMRELATVRELVEANAVRRSLWEKQISAQLRSQDLLLETLTALAVELQAATSALTSVVERLDAATAEPARRPPKRRSA